MRHCICAATVGLAVLSSPAQQVPTRTLVKPDVEYAEPFSGLTAVLELGSGRVVVADNRDRTLQVVDLASGSATGIGREGAGPLEWGRPMRLLRMPGDTTYVYDAANSRFLLVAPDGKPVRTFSPIAAAATQRGAADRNPAGVAGTGTGRSGRASGGMTSSVGGISSASVLNSVHADARGRMYYLGFPIVMTDQGPAAVDSMPILRQIPTATTADTVAFLQNPPDVSDVSGSGGRVSYRVNFLRPYENGDGWVVFPNGRVVIARVADYHLDVITPGGDVIRGAPVRYTPVRVTAADKRQWREARAGATMTTVRGQTIPLAGLLPDQDSWPVVKSPFPTNAVFAAPNGDVWVFRYRTDADHVPVADVFDARGSLIGRVALPSGVRPIGLGLRGVYAIRADDDGLQYLQRYAFVWESCTPDLASNCRAR